MRIIFVRPQSCWPRKSGSREKEFLRRVEGPILEILFPYMLLNAIWDTQRGKAATKEFYKIMDNKIIFPRVGGEVSNE